MLYGIQKAELSAVWPHVCADIAEAALTSRGKFTAEDMYQELADGTCQLWLWRSETAQGLAVTQIHSYKRNKCCWVRICVGNNYREWIGPGLRRIEEWAKAHGCDAMELCARPGWSRALKDYEMTHLYLEKKL